MAAAVSAAGGFHKYEGAPLLDAICREGAEPEMLRAALNLPKCFAAAECRKYDADVKVISLTGWVIVGTAPTLQMYPVHCNCNFALDHRLRCHLRRIYRCNHMSLSAA